MIIPAAALTLVRSTLSAGVSKAASTFGDAFKSAQSANEPDQSGPAAPGTAKHGHHHHARAANETTTSQTGSSVAG